MILKGLCNAVIFGSLLLLPFDLGADGAITSVEELLTYACARGVGAMIESADQLGPIFSQGPLVLTSVTAADNSALLIVSAGAGTFVIPLDHAGVNRLRFELYTSQSSKPQLFFVTYTHDPAFRSRLFEFSMMRAPVGKEELDYRLVQPQRAAYLRPHIEYAIWETSTTILSAISDGSLKRERLNARIAVADCEHLSRKSPELARNLRRNLDELGVIAPGPRENSRSPASSARPVHADLYSTNPMTGQFTNKPKD